MKKSLTIAAAAFAAVVAVVNCSSSSEDDKALCMQGCNKTKMCAGALGASLDCTMTCNNQTAEKCTNESELRAGFKACLAKDKCEEFTPCLTSLPECIPVAGGTDGSTTNTGGTSGTGGASCDPCVKADACFTAAAKDAGVAGGGMFAPSCNAAAGAQRDQAIMACTQLLTALNCK